MILARDVKDKRKGFCKYRMTKGWLGKIWALWLMKRGTQDMEKAEVPNTKFASVFTSKTSHHEFQVQRPGERLAAIKM